MRESNCVDFDDLLSLSVALLQQHPSVRDELQQQWRHVLVDEFQVSACHLHRLEICHTMLSIMSFM